MTVLRGPFTFDPARHEYRVGGVQVPGVHAVLSAGGVEQAGPWFDPVHRQRGRVVHAATLAWDLGMPGWGEDLKPEWGGYMAAYQRFRREVKTDWRKLEHAKVNRLLKYASVIDRVGTVSGRLACFEIKTGSPAPFHGPQLAGVDMLLGRGRGAYRRLAVYLCEDGTYQLREFTEDTDYARFLRALHIYWSEAHRDAEKGDGACRQ